MSHSLIQSVPRLLSLSVSRSFTHSIPLSLFAHLTSPSLTHSPALSPHIHHFARLSCQVFFWPSAANFLSAKLFCSLKAARVFFVCFVGPCSSSLVPQNLLSVFFYLALSSLFSFCHLSLLLLGFVLPSTPLVRFPWSFSIFSSRPCLKYLSAQYPEHLLLHYTIPHGLRPVQASTANAGSKVLM